MFSSETFWASLKTVWNMWVNQLTWWMRGLVCCLQCFLIVLLDVNDLQQPELAITQLSLLLWSFGVWWLNALQACFLWSTGWPHLYSRLKEINAECKLAARINFVGHLDVRLIALHTLLCGLNHSSRIAALIYNWSPFHGFRLHILMKVKDLPVV